MFRNIHVSGQRHHRENLRALAKRQRADERLALAAAKRDRRNGKRAGEVERQAEMDAFKVNADELARAYRRLDHLLGN